MTPKEEARDIIDGLLDAVGWKVQDYRKINLGAGLGVAVQEFPLKIGDQIPIEQRAADEVRFLGKERITPDGVEVYNPAFDVTPAENITAIISEKGPIRHLTEEKIRRMLEQKL